MSQNIDPPTAAELRARLAAIIESSDDAIISKSLAGIIESWNQGATELYGYSAQEIIGHAIELLIPPDRRDEFPWIMERIARGESVDRYETQRVCKDGSRIDVSITVSPVRDADGRVVAASIIARDVTERKRNDVALRRYAEIVRSMPIGVNVWRLENPDDLGSFRLLAVNPAASKVSGLAMEDFIGQTMSEVFPAARESPALYAEVIRTGEPRTLPAMPSRDDRGALRYYAVNVFPLPDNAVGVAFEDVTGRTQAQFEVDQANERFAKAFHSGPGAQVIVRVSDSLILDVNEQFEHLFGYSREEVLGQKSNTYQFYADPQQLVEAGKILAQGAAVSNYEVTITTKSGELRDTLMWIEWIDINGEKCVFGYHVDITDRKRMEEMERINRGLVEATRLKSEFLANMSHELRTPLNAIIGFSEVLQDETFGPLNTRQERYVGNVLDSGRHLLELVNDILDISKIEAGRMELHREDLDVASILSEVRERMLPLVERKRQHLRLELPHDALMVRADRGRFIQILLNLLSNAVKFTPEEGTISIACRPEGSQVAIAVSDTGIGIAEKNLDRIFDEFEQVDSSVGRVQQGTGLGLTLTRRLTELHGGSIAVASEVDRGSTFTVLLPSILLEASTGGKLGTVLVVEDDTAARELLQITLAEQGYGVAWVDRIDQVLPRARALQPVAITLDLLVGGELSWPALQALKADPATRNIPVVIISILDEEGIGLALGASAYLTKPVTRQVLLDTIQSLVEHSTTPERGLRILAVDDDPAARELIVLALEGTPHHVVQAASAEEALERLDAAPVDLVIADLMMEPMSGFDLIEVLSKRPDTRGVPIVVLTARELSPGDIRRLNGSIAAALSKNGFTRRHFLQELRRVTGIKTDSDESGVRPAL
jgi:PAS domain S-box-containing protein